MVCVLIRLELNSIAAAAYYGGLVAANQLRAHQIHCAMPPPSGKSRRRRSLHGQELPCLCVVAR